MMWFNDEAETYRKRLEKLTIWREWRSHTMNGESTLIFMIMRKYEKPCWLRTNWQSSIEVETFAMLGITELSSRFFSPISEAATQP